MAADAHRVLLRRYGVTPAAMRCITRLDNEVWRVRRPAGSDLALRIYPARQQDVAAIGLELDWLDALAAAGLHVPRPWRDREGTRLQRLDDGRHAALFDWLGGRQHFGALTPARLRAVGRFTGAAHRIGAALGIVPRREAMPIDLSAWAAGDRPGLERLPRVHRTALPRAAARLQVEAAGFVTGSDVHALIHGDLHPWNLLFVRGAAGAIDFSDCGRGLPAMDLAATLQYLRHPIDGHADHRPQYRALHDALLDGYAAEQALPPQAPRQVEVLIATRLFGTLEWMLDDWPRLDLRPWGPGFVRRLPQALGAWADR